MKEIRFVKAVYKLSELPEQKYPEIALCGRSNVGKSSFINCLLSSKVAKTSSLPGKTRSINYYLVDNKFFFVDLPGFGYAKVSKDERDTWQKLIDAYFNAGRNIKLAVHFIDSRHEPTNLDITLNGFLKGLGLKHCIILNKADKLNQSELAKAKKNILQLAPEMELNKDFILFSAINGLGKKEAIKLINSTIIA